MRDEAALRAASPLSPVLLHIGVYCFRRGALEAFSATPASAYERLEGLEQLRALEAGLTIEAVVVESTPFTSSGIDTAEDVCLAERAIAAHGDPFIDWRE